MPSQEGVVVEVEQWAEIRRMHTIERLSIKEIHRRTGRSRVTIRRALRAEEPPRYERGPVESKLDPHKEEIHRLLAAEPKMPGTRIRELIEGSGYEGGRTILDDYLREMRPLFVPARTFGRTSYRPGEIGQFDLWEPSRPIPVGCGQERRGWVVVACLGYSRAGAGALIFSKRAEDILWGIGRCLWRLGGLPGTLVWDREGALHAGGGRPSEAFAAFCGQLRVGWRFCAPADPQAKGVVERLQGYMRTSFEPGRVFANEIDFATQLEAWFEAANARTHRALRFRPAERLGDDLAAMAPLPGDPPDVDRRIVLRVPPDPYVRVDTNDYSLDPRFVGRRVEARIGQREITAVVLDTGEIAAAHRRSFARHRTITDLAHARALRQGREAPGEPQVERRPLDRYDALIPA
ncbi:MAG: IS21 family transposase [Thermoleophilia bacterium]